MAAAPHDRSSRGVPNEIWFWDFPAIAPDPDCTRTPSTGPAQPLDAWLIPL